MMITILSMIKKLLLICFAGFLFVCCSSSTEEEILVKSVTMSQETAEMLIGETVQLQAIVTPTNATDTKIVWASSRQSVATVSSSGLVTAVALGTSTITASCGGKSAKCEVTVFNGTVAVVSVALDVTSVTLEEMQTTRLVATVSPGDATDKTVTWTSSDSSIATVNQEGLVTGIKEGQATITAKAGEKSAECVVTVKKKVVPVTAVSINKSSLALTIGESETLTATVSPEDATDKTVTWSSSDATVVDVDQTGKVTALKGGKVTITAKAGEKSAQAEVDVMEVTPVSVEVEGGGGSFDVTVVTTRNYRLKSKPAWVVEKSVAHQVHHFEAAVNNKTTERTGDIVFCDDKGTSLSCAVKQKGNRNLSVSPSSLSFDALGGTSVLEVSTALDWTVASSANWCRVSPSNGSGTGTITVAVDEHRGEEVRNATITVASGDIIRTVNVLQEGAIPFSVNPTSVEMGEEGGDFTVTVSSSFGYHLGYMSDWISEVSVVDKVHTFRVTSNTGTEERSGIISFCDDGGTCIPVVVRQTPPLLGWNELDWSKEFYHRSLFMRFTATWCVWCPQMYESVLRAQAEYPGRIQHVAIHGYDSELYSASVAPLSGFYQVSSYPTGFVDGRVRIKNDDVDIAAPKIVAAVKETESLYGTNTGIAVRSSLSGRKVEIGLTVFAKKAGRYKLSVLLLEDDILASQTGAPGGVFYHKDVARATVTNLYGDSFNVSNNQSCKSFSYSTSIPDKCAIEHMKILVYVQSERNGGYVDNCLVAPLGKYVRVQMEGSVSGGNEGIVPGDDINYRKGK